MDPRKAERRERARYSTCDVLEQEFKLLHEKSNFPQSSTEDGQLRANAELREKELFKLVHALDEHEARSALCLSGGGIRSATFCLGVLQGLARCQLLDRFHYLSTVSGGGYIGSWLTSWIHRASAPAGSPSTQSAISDLAQATSKPPIGHLRAYSNYLSPAWGISGDFLALTGIFARNLLLNWVVSVPLLLALLLLPRLHLSVLRMSPLFEPTIVWWGTVSAIVLALACLAISVAYATADLPGPLSPSDPKNRFVIWGLGASLVSALALSLAGTWILDPGARPNDLGRWLVLNPLLSVTDRLRELSPPWILSWILTPLTSRPWGAVAGAATVLAIVGGAAWGRLVWRQRRGLPPRTEPGPVWVLVSAVIVGIAFGVGLYVAWDSIVAPEEASLSTAYGAAIRAASREPVVSHWYAAFAMPAVLLLHWLLVTLYVGVSRRRRDEPDREWWSRASAYCLGTAIVIAALWVLVIFVPVWLMALPGVKDYSGPASLTALVAVLGVVTSAWGFWSKHGELLKKRSEGVLDALGLRLLDLVALLFVLLLLVVMNFGISGVLQTDSDLEQRVGKATQNQTWTYREERRCAQPCPLSCRHDGCPVREPDLPVATATAVAYGVVLDHSHPGILGIAIVVLVVVGAGASLLFGVNTFSLHNMYCNRLTRAYLGATRPQRRPHWFTGFDPDDNMSMSSAKPKDGRLFHVINAALNLSKPAGHRLEWQQRKAASFTISPLHCGSPALGFAPTAAFGKTEGGLSVGRAMAISGAAASPNMGYHSSPLVTFVMSLFNVRLGWWLPNPSEKFAAKWANDEPAFPLRESMREALARTSDDRDYVYLSDGGHFENLGLYEMVRRRCRRLVVVDATRDPEYRYEDLEASLRKIRVDFGISVEFPAGLPSAESAKRTGQHFAIGKVRYGDVDGPTAPDGTIVYLKPVLSGDEPLDVLNYAESTRKRGSVFPHQSTADQFFDESQFESYRLLGLHTVLKSFAGSGGWRLTSDGDHRPRAGGPAAGAATAASASPPTAADEAGPAEAVNSSFGKGWESLGGAAKAVGAAAIGGALVLTGSIALKNTELTLSERDRALLGALASGGTTDLSRSVDQLGHALRVALLASSAARSTSSPDPAASISRGGAAPTVPAVNLVDALDKLASAIDKAASARALDPLEKQITAVSLQLDLLTVEVRQRGVGTVPSAALEQAAKSLSAAAVALGAAAARLQAPASASGPVTLTLDDALKTKLEKAASDLSAIREEMTRLPPRRNVRGSTDGAKP